MPLGGRQHSPSPLPFRPAMHREIYYPARNRSRSPMRPVKVIKIHEDEDIKPDKQDMTAQEWAADKENLYNQIEKLTLRLDLAYAGAASHRTRIAELEKYHEDRIAQIQKSHKDHVTQIEKSHKDRVAEFQKDLKDKARLMGEYQKRVREHMAEKKESLVKMTEVVELCEKFKGEVVKLSHELHCIKTTKEDTEDMNKLRLQKQCTRLRLERNIARDKLSEALNAKGETLVGWPDIEKRIVKGGYVSPR